MVKGVFYAVSSLLRNWCKFLPRLKTTFTVYGFMNSTEQFIQDVIDQIVRNIIISLQQIICKQKHDRKIFYITISFKKTPFVTSRLTFKCIKHSKFSNKQFKTSEKNIEMINLE